MISRAAAPVNMYSYVADIANSGIGYLYEDANGLISYGDADHRQDYLVANGYVNLDANHALAEGIRSTTRQGDIVNDLVINYKTITFPADTTGAFDNDNNGSLVITWGLGAGSNYTTGSLQTTWGTNTAANRFVGQTNLASATNNYWQITGVQLEVGATATPFEFKPYAQDLAECQRYYYRNTPGNLNGNYCLAQVRSTTQVEPVIHFPVTMRTVPTSLEFSNLAILRAGISVTAITAATLPSDESTPNSAKIAATTNTSGASAGQVVTVQNNNSTAGYLAFSAEL